jgi:hypothetical protein
MKGGGKGGPVFKKPFNMSNMASALENISQTPAPHATKTKVKTKVKTKHLYTKKRATRFSKKNYTKVVKSNINKSEKMFDAIKKLKSLYNHTHNEHIRDYYGTIELDLRDNFALITGDDEDDSKKISETPFEYILSVEYDNHSSKTIDNLYKLFISVLNKHYKDKEHILEIFKNASKSETNALTNALSKLSF